MFPTFTYADGYNFFLGIVSMIAIHTTINWWQTRRREYVYYALYISCQWLFFALMRDDIVARHSINETWLLSFTRPSSIILYNIFAIEFLELRKKSPWLYRCAVANILIAGAALLAMMWVHYLGMPDLARQIIDTVKLVIFVLGLCVVMGILRRADRTAKYFVMGSFFLIGLETANVVIGMVCHTTEGLNHLRHLSPDSIFSHPNFLTFFAVLSDLVCLSLGLVYRNHQIAMSKLRAQLEHQQIRIMTG